MNLVISVDEPLDFRCPSNVDLQISPPHRVIQCNKNCIGLAIDMVIVAQLSIVDIVMEINYNNKHLHLYMTASAERDCPALTKLFLN